MSISRTISLMRRTIVTRKKYLKHWAQRRNEHAYATNDNRAVPQSYIRAHIDFVRFLHIQKFEWIACVLQQIAGTRQFLHQWREFMVITAIVVQLNLSYQLDFDALMLQFATGLLQRDIHLKREQSVWALEWACYVFFSTESHYAVLLHAKQTWSRYSTMQTAQCLFNVSRLQAHMCVPCPYLARHCFTIIVQQILFLFAILCFHFGQFTCVGSVKKYVDVCWLAKPEKILQKNRIESEISCAVNRSTSPKV